MDEEASDAVVLAVMEAATNALSHSLGAGAIEVGLHCDAKELVISVRDDGQGFDPSLFPLDETPDLASLGGRGLFLIGRLVDHVDFRFDGGTEVLMRKRLLAGGTSDGVQSAVQTARNDLRTSLADVLETCDDGFALLDWDWRLLSVNEALLAFLRSTGEPLQGRTLFELLPELSDADYESSLRAAMDEGNKTSIELYVERWHAWFEVRVLPVSVGIAVVLVEVSQRKISEAEHERERAGNAVLRATLMAMTEIRAVMRARQDIAESARACGSVVARALTSTAGYVTDGGMERRDWPYAFALRAPLAVSGGPYREIAVGRSDRDYSGDESRALAMLATVVSEELERARASAQLELSWARARVLADVAAAGADVPEQAAAAVLDALATHLGLESGSVDCFVEGSDQLLCMATHGTASEQSVADRQIAVPVAVGETRLGVLTLAFCRPRDVNAEDVAFFHTLADLLGLALQRSRLAEERRRQRRLLQRAGELSLVLDVVNDTVREVREPADAIAHAAQRAAEALDVTFAAVWLCSDEHWSLLIDEECDEPTRQRTLSCATLLRTAGGARAVCSALSHGFVDSADRPLCTVGTSLVAGGVGLGAVVFVTASRREFSEPELDFLDKLGSVLGGALQNARLYDALNTQLELADLLLRASKVLTEWTDLAPMLDRLSEVLLLSAPGSRVSIALFEAANTMLHIAASTGIAPLARGDAPLDSLSGDVLGIFSAPSTLVVDYEARPDDRLYFLGDCFAPRYGLYVPIASRGKLVGLLILEAPAARGGFRPDEIQAVEAIADQAATAIENARLFDAEVDAQRRAARELEISQMLLTIAGAFASQTDSRQLLDTVARTLTRSFGDARVTISLLSDAEEMTIVAAAGEHPFSVGTIFALDDFSGPARRSLESGRAALVDYEAIPLSEGSVSLSWGMRISVVAPLVTRGRTIGLLTIDHANQRWGFTRRDVSLAQGIADQAAIAIYNTALFEKEREEAQFGEALDEAGRLLHSTLDSDAILAGALESGGRAVHATSGVIALAERSRWVVRYQHGYAIDLVGRAWPDEEVPFMVEARRRRGPVVLDDILGDHRAMAGSSRPPGVRAVLTVPLAIGDEVVGVLVYNKGEVASFSEREVTFATRLALSVSLALQNARLFANEHTIAETLQGALLAMPESIPGFHFAHAYHSATVAARVGGDFYDLFELTKGVVGVVVGDVSGKGLEAAVTTSVVKNALRAQAVEREKSPAEVMRAVNEVLLRASAPEVFSSVFFGVIDDRGGRLAYCNAGHTPAFVMRRDGTVDELDPTGPVVGAFPDMAFAGAETTLAPDELLFLYTDGLIEARAMGVLFGEPRLRALFNEAAMLDPVTAVQRVAAAVVDFTDGLLTDDLALLAVARSAVADV